MAKIQDKLYNRIIEGELLEITEKEKVKLGLGKKLYLHEIVFDYTTGNASDFMTSRYKAVFLSSDNTIKTPVSNLETFVANSIFIRGVKENNEGLYENQYQILMIPEGDYNIGFVIIDTGTNNVLSDANEDFTIVSDIVTEWN